MAGKRLLDVAALFNASRGVAQKHIALRGRQLDVYNRTSTLARAVRYQTERITETAKAASIIASRLNENAPAWTAEVAEEEPVSQSKDGEVIPSKDASEGNAAQTQQAEGLEQDHFYKRSETTSAFDEKSTEDLEVKQVKADRYPLPDGTIPPVESKINVLPVDQDSVSTKQKDGPLRELLERDGLKPNSSGASSIPTPKHIPLSPETARWTQRRFEEQIPSRTADALDETSVDPLEEGHDKDSFYRRPGHTSPTLSSLPRVKIPKHISDTQEGILEEINSDTFHGAGEKQTSAHIPSAQAVPEQEQIPEGINTDLFYSPRIAKMLGGKTHAARENNLKLKVAKSTPMDHTELADGKDQAAFNVRSSSQELPSTPEISLSPKISFSPTDASEDFDQLAQDLAQESEQSSKVSLHFEP